jgi:hypothetical protein
MQEACKVCTLYSFVTTRRGLNNPQPQNKGHWHDASTTCPTRVSLPIEVTLPPTEYICLRLPLSVSLERLKTLVANWKMDWDSEDVWSREYNIVKTRVYEQDEGSIRAFWSGTKDHASEGRSIIDNITKFISNTKWSGEDCQSGNLMEACQMLLMTAMEMKFFKCQAELRSATSKVHT